MSEQQEFLKDLEIKPEDKFEIPLTEETPEKEPEEEGLEPKNRQERRLLRKVQQLREENIATQARLQGITEAQKLRETTEEADFLKLVDPIYGTDTPEKREATEILKKALRGAYETAKREAKDETLKEVESRETNASQAVAQEEENIDEILERVEDDTDLDLSEGGADRKGFLTLMEKLSPKDKDGDIIEFADPDAVAEIYLSRRGKTNSRAKELAARSMTQSGASQPSKLEISATERFLKENGIL